MSFDNLKIGVMVNSRLEHGGAFSQAVYVINQLKNEKNNDYIYLSDEPETVDYLNKIGLKASLVYRDFRQFLKGVIKLNCKIMPRRISDIIKRESIEIIYFIGPYNYFKKIKNCKFIFTINDLCHRDRPEFKEISRQEFKRRDNVYGNGSREALLTIVDSEHTKLKLNQYYGVDLRKIAVVDFGISKSLINYASQNKKTENATEYGNYIYYPAQYWPHKNHKFLVDAIEILVKIHKLNWSVIFTGSDTGNKKEVWSYIKEKELSNYFYDLGFVSEVEKNRLYLNAKCMVMPTWFGPTNIPPLEAFASNTPVIYSMQGDEGGIFEKYATLVDLRNVQTLVKAILKVAANDNEVLEKCILAKMYVDKRMSNNLAAPILNYLEEYKVMRHAWK